MMQPNFSTFQRLAQISGYVSVFQELPYAFLTPLQIYELFRASTPETVLFHVGEEATLLSPYVVVLSDPLVRLTKTTKEIVTEKNEDKEANINAFFDQVNCLHETVARGIDEGLRAFATTLMGGMSFEASYLFHHLHLGNSDKTLIEFSLYRYQVIFVPRQMQCYLQIVVHCSENLANDYARAKDQCDALVARLLMHRPEIRNIASDQNEHLSAQMSDSAFRQLVEVGQQYITKGDIFQIVLSREFNLKGSFNPVDLFQILQQGIQAPYYFIFPFQNELYVGASPEKLLSYERDILEMHPIAGTVQSNNFATEREAELALLLNRKECAEHMMLVDLSRNDLGKIAEIGSVKVAELKSIKKAGNLRHLVSSVQSTLAKVFTVFDALRAVFPAGTLSGAPKKRALELIQSLENGERGLYGGAIIHCSGSGALQSCIAIRMIKIANHLTTIRAGAGVVLHSVPQKEANETRAKAQAIARVLSPKRRAV